MQNRKAILFGVFLGSVFFPLGGCVLRSPLDQLVNAAGLGDTNKVIRLLGAGVPINGIEKAGLHQTALAAAAAAQNKIMVSLLLQKGADPNIKSGLLGTTPLMEAIFHGSDNMPVIRLLVDSGSRLDTTDTYGNTALNLAEGRRDQEVINYLKSKGAPKNFTNSGNETNATRASGRSVPFKVIVNKPN